MYTLEQLQCKTFKELKEIGWQLNVFPSADRRCRQSWIDAIAGVNLPLLQLLEVSPAIEVEPVAEAIEVQATEPIESKFGRIVYPKLATEPIVQATKNPLGVEADQSPPMPLTFSDSFLALYSPPQFENIFYKSDADGQLSLLDFEVLTEPEPPDPDDYESMFAFWAAYDAWEETHPDDDSEHCEPSSDSFEPLEVLLTSLDSMCEWAPCPDDWYEPDTLVEPSEVLELLPVIESSDTCKFLIPVFGVLGDRTNGNFLDEPPTAGVGARRSLPKPPSFPPAFVAGDRFAENEKRCPCGAMPAAQCDGTTATHIYPDRIVFTPCYKSDLISTGLVLCDRAGGRSPPGGDAVF